MLFKFAFNILSNKFYFSVAYTVLGLPGWLGNKESACNAGDLGSVPGAGRSLGGGHGTHSSSFFLEDAMDRGPWGLQSTGHRIEHH